MTRSKLSLMKRAVLTVALVAATAGVASADDGGVGRFSESYQYFSTQPVDKSASEWRAENPNGLTERQLQGFSAANGEAWKLNRPTFDKTPSGFRIARPNGLTEREYQALSSEGFAWHSGPAGGALTSGDTNNETLAARVAQFFHPAKAEVPAQ